jgi:Flp pilus assembly protein TadG
MSVTHRTTNRAFGVPRSFRQSSQSGQSLVEFAIMLPLLLLLVLGVIEIGRYAYVGILVGNAARAGVAYGSQTHITAGDITGITAAVNNDYQNNGLFRDNNNNLITALTVNKAYACGCDNSGTISVTDCTSGICPIGQHKVVSLQVTASGNFSSLFRYPGIPTPLNVSRTATMRIGT